MFVRYFYKLLLWFESHFTLKLNHLVIFMFYIQKKDYMFLC